MQHVQTVTHEEIPGLQTKINYSPENIATNSEGEQYTKDGYFEILLIVNGKTEFSFYIVTKTTSEELDITSETHTVIVLSPEETLTELGVQGFATAPMFVVTTIEDAERYGRVYTLQSLVPLH